MCVQILCGNGILPSHQHRKKRCQFFCAIKVARHFEIICDGEVRGVQQQCGHRRRGGLWWGPRWKDTATHPPPLPQCLETHLLQLQAEEPRTPRRATPGSSMRRTVSPTRGMVCKRVSGVFVGWMTRVCDWHWWAPGSSNPQTLRCSVSSGY